MAISPFQPFYLHVILLLPIFVSSGNENDDSHNNNNSPYNYPSYYYHFVPRDRMLAGPLTHRPGASLGNNVPNRPPPAAVVPQVGTIDGFRRLRLCTVGQHEYEQCRQMRRDLNPADYNPPRSIISVRRDYSNPWPVPITNRHHEDKENDDKFLYSKNNKKTQHFLTDTAIECVRAVDKLECMQMIGFNSNLDSPAVATRSRTYYTSASAAAGSAIFDNTLADIVRLSAGEAALAALRFDMVPILQETMSDDGNTFLDAAVLVVRNGINTLHELRQRRVAFGKFGDTLAWQIPMTSLYAGGVVRRPRCNETFADVAVEFFDSSCVPHDPKDFGTFYDFERYAKLCEACGMASCRISDAQNAVAPRWEATLELLQAGRVDAAFTSWKTLDRWLSEAKINEGRFQLLCPFTFVHEDGVPRPIPGRPISTASLRSFLGCNFGLLPTDTFMLWRQNPHGHQLAQTLAALYNRFAANTSPNSDTVTWKNLLRGRYENNHHHDGSSAVLYADGARELTLPPQQDMRNVLGDGFLLYWLEDESARTTCDTTSTTTGRQVYRWCVAGGSGERQKCDAMRLAAQAARLRPLILCTSAADEHGCVVQVRQRQADLTVVDAVEAYYATRYEELVPAAAENFYTSGDVVYVVAVSRNARINSLHETRGATACFSGYQTAAGWHAPVMAFYRLLLVQQPQTCRVEQAFAEWFGDMCVPGALSAELHDDDDTRSFGEGRRPVDPIAQLKRRMCALCRRFGSALGNIQNPPPPSATCSSTSDNYYAGNSGALRCLSDGVADVAFISSSALDTIPINERRRYHLLCGGGDQQRGSASLDEYASCNLGTVPGRVALMHWSASRPQERLIMQTFLRDLSHTFGGRIDANVNSGTRYRTDARTFNLFSPRNETDDTGVYYALPEMRYVEAQSVDRWTAATQPPPMRLYAPVYTMFSESTTQLVPAATRQANDDFLSHGEPLALAQLAGLLDRRSCHEFLNSDQDPFGINAAKHLTSTGFWTVCVIVIQTVILNVWQL